MSTYENPPTSGPGSQSSSVKKSGCLLGWIGLLLGLSPLIFVPVALITCGPNANEGNCGPAAAPWLLMFTVPFGVLIGIVGLVIWIVGKVKKT